jgi:prepilin-type N-terminal cleavage/methylation domain-containing protein
MRRLFVSSWCHPPVGRRGERGPHAAFTLIELLVVVVILMVLASLSLAGLAGVRQRAKADKTRSTIRKIDAVIRPMYDSYPNRRVAASSSTDRRAMASNVLTAKRLLMAREMPDSWDDVATVVSSSLPNTANAYVGYRNAWPSLDTTKLASHECLFMIVTRSGFEPDALEMFRADEIIDYDGDGANEFSDGWGSPIAFMRWPSGFVAPLSPLQIADADAYHDPLDPLRVDFDASDVTRTGYALVPLVYSAGPDEQYGLVKLASWSTQNLTNVAAIKIGGQRPGEPDSSTAGAYRDNITNHDLSTR